jgi:hypothetical protein
MDSDAPLTTITLGTGRVAPDDDIDIYALVDGLRMERMSEEGLWLAGYPDDDTDWRYDFWVGVTEDNDLAINWQITTRLPRAVFPDDWQVADAEGVVCATCGTTAGPERQNLLAHYALDHPGLYGDVVESELGVRPESVSIHDKHV